MIRLLKNDRPAIEVVPIDASTMLKSARQHLANDPHIKLVSHDLSLLMPDLEYFNVVVSLYLLFIILIINVNAGLMKIYDIVTPTGIFCILKSAASPSVDFRIRFASYGMHS